MERLRIQRLYHQRGNSDKVYILELLQEARADGDIYFVVAHYGKRIAPHLRREVKISTMSSAVARNKYDKILREKTGSSDPAKRYVSLLGVPESKRAIIADIVLDSLTPAVSQVTKEQTNSPSSNTGEEYLNLRI